MCVREREREREREGKKDRQGERGMRLVILLPSSSVAIV